MTAAQNLELHRLVIAAACAGTVPESLLAADFRMEQHVCSMTDRAYRGPDGWRDWNNDLFEEFCPGARLDIEAILAAEHDRVVAALCLSGTNVHTGAPIEFRWSEVTWFEGGKAARTIGFTTPREALHFAGIDERRLPQTHPDIRFGRQALSDSDEHRGGDSPETKVAAHPSLRRRLGHRRFAQARLGGAIVHLAHVASSWLPARSSWA